MNKDKNLNIADGCSAPGCHLLITLDPQSEDRAFYFPEDPERRKAWAIALGKEDWVPDNNSFVCHKHFVTGEPSSDPSHADYVPSVFAYPSSEEKDTKRLIEYQNDEESEADDISEPMIFDLAECIWNEKDDFKLLDLVKQNKHIYDKSHKDHGNQLVMDITWQMIANNMRRPVEGCQIRFNHLYERFCTVLNNRKELDSTSEVLKNFLQKMMFLWDYVEEEIDKSDNEGKRKKFCSQTETRSAAAYKRALANKHSMVSTNRTARNAKTVKTKMAESHKVAKGHRSSETLKIDEKDDIGSNAVFVNIIKRYLDRIEDQDKLSDLRFRILTLLSEYV